MTLHDAMTWPVQRMSYAEIDEARKLIGDEKLKVRQSITGSGDMGKHLVMFRKLNARLDALNIEELDSKDADARSRVRVRRF